MKDERLKELVAWLGVSITDVVRAVDTAIEAAIMNAALKHTDSLGLNVMLTQAIDVADGTRVWRCFIDDGRVRFTGTGATPQEAVIECALLVKNDPTFISREE